MYESVVSTSCIDDEVDMYESFVFAIVLIILNEHIISELEKQTECLCGFVLVGWAYIYFCFPL